jgi:hypothetical protein
VTKEINPSSRNQDEYEDPLSIGYLPVIDLDLPVGPSFSGTRESHDPGRQTP